jgi:5-methylcytosine-specific restriction endonuclease McrA
MPTLTADGRRLNGKRGGGWITPLKRLAIYIRDGFTCGYCGRDLTEAAPREVSLDHLRPRCHGGGNAATNLITACVKCNSARQHRSWKDFAPAGAHDRIMRVRRRTLNLALARAVKDGAVSREAARAELAR